MNDRNGKPFDLEERTFNFARDSRDFVKFLPRTISNKEELHRDERGDWEEGLHHED